MFINILLKKYKPKYKFENYIFLDHDNYFLVSYCQVENFEFTGWV